MVVDELQVHRRVHVRGELRRQVERDAFALRRYLAAVERQRPRRALEQRERLHRERRRSGEAGAAVIVRRQVGVANLRHVYLGVQVRRQAGAGPARERDATAVEQRHRRRAERDRLRRGERARHFGVVGVDVDLEPVEPGDVDVGVEREGAVFDVAAAGDGALSEPFDMERARAEIDVAAAELDRSARRVEAFAGGDVEVRDLGVEAVLPADVEVARDLVFVIRVAVDVRGHAEHAADVIDDDGRVADVDVEIVHPARQLVDRRRRFDVQVHVGVAGADVAGEAGDADRPDRLGRRRAEGDRAVGPDGGVAARARARLDLALEHVVGDAAELHDAARFPLESAHLPADAGVRVRAARGHVRFQIAVEHVAGEQVDGAAVDGDIERPGFDVHRRRGQLAGEVRAVPVRLRSSRTAPGS